MARITLRWSASTVWKTRQRIIWSISALLLCAAAGAITLRETVTANPVYPTAPPEDIRAAADDNNAFAIDLYAQLAQRPGNLLFSPYSIDTALSMAYAGARGNTATQMARTLHVSLSGEHTHIELGALSGKLANEAVAGNKTLYQLSVADALWTQRGFPYNPDFLRLLSQDYASELHQSDFRNDAPRAAADINQWVSQKTANKIPSLLSPGSLDSGTRMVLVNAIYFKGNWATQFEKSQTSDQPFHLNDRQDVKAPLMFENVYCPAREDADLQAVELPYDGDTLSMVILLPLSFDGLAALEQKLTPQFIDQWMSRLVTRPVNVYLPKFKLSCYFGLAEVLRSMGMPDAFDNMLGDFSGITTADRLHIGAVVHAAMMDVNEEGTEAAAATAIDGQAHILMAAPPPPPPMEFRADHPFMFLLRERSSGAILFAGRLTDPTAAAP